MEHTYDFNVFHQEASPFHSSRDDFFFDINTFYEREKEDETFPPNLQRNLTDYFADGPQVEPFVLSAPPAFQDEEEEQPDLFRSAPNPFHEELSTPFKEEKRPPPKSIATKNVCFNICQKTVKMIQKGVYSKKVENLCDYYGVNEEEFLNHIVCQKKYFTGPKALAMYVESESAFAHVFRDFMKWFLKQKYLRHCLSGDMKDKEAYIKYKNEVILVILE